ncbi:MAG TPA: PAS domain S-box protein [Segetibacter sp.]|jgi:PAS domain S-box-containing protein
MQEDYQLLFDSIKDYAIIKLDRSGNIASWNAGAERMKGYSEDEIIGKHFSILFTEQDIEKEKPAKELHAALTKGRYEEESWRIRKDGSKFWANIIITPVYSDTKEHIGYAKISRDLTEKIRSEELYLLLVNQVKEYAIFMLDTTGTILTWNEGAERIKGYTAHDIIGKHFSIFYSAEEKLKPDKELAIAIRTGKYEEEGWRIRKDGSRFWASVVITPIYTDRHIGFAKVTRDLTERKDMEKMTRANVILEGTNKELERFASTASHDLKEPLRKMNTFSEMILNEAKDQLSEKHQRYLSKIIASGKRMNTMIDDILDLSALSKKEHFEKCDLQNIVSETLDTLEQAIEDAKAIVNYKALPSAIIIPSQMRQLFQNLISNSIKFSKKEDPPVLNITHEYLPEVNTEEKLWPADQYLQIKVADNGIGFEQEHAEKIFHLFDRLHSKSAYEGTGLGLAICKKIAENHGGTIIAQSQPGKGSIFTLIIPA